MPQASHELQERWGTDDEKAWAQLAGKVIDIAGLLSFRKGYQPTGDDLSAVAFLCEEFDYGYKPTDN